MARDMSKCFSFATKNCGLAVAALFLVIQGAASQRVKVQPEVVSYPGETISLRCTFPDKGDIQLTQVSWIWEPSDEGVRDNIAVFHPQFGASYPESPFTGRVTFPNPSLDNPSITIADVKMTDEGNYICEYATYPSGNEQGTTVLVILAKPKNTASIVSVIAGEKSVLVATCKSANGKPPAQVSWVTALTGNATTTSQLEEDNTVTVSSEYRMVPKPRDNGKDLSCLIAHRAQEKPQSIPLKLVIEYPPQVDITGYDNNWYVGRTNVALTCEATANPVADSVVWKAMSGPMPDTVQVKNKVLTVLKVDDRVNTTFVCEVKNRLGVGKDQVTAVVRDKRLPAKGATTGSIIGAIIGVIVLLAIIATAVVMIRKHRQGKDADAPPNYKPPPPKKTGGSTELTSSRENVTESLPLSNLYYETNGEPVTNLDSYHDDDDDDEPRYYDNSGHAGAPSGLDDSGLDYPRGEAVDEPVYTSPMDEEDYPGNEEEPRGREEEPRGREEELEPEPNPNPNPVPSRGDSFMSPAMYV